MEKREYCFLGRVDSPEKLKTLTPDETKRLAEEIRAELVHRVTENGGHLASNLGVVELTLALHRVFDCPRDHIVFDVGHQSYVHKMLTGRYDKMDTLRKAGGLSGFTKREESEYDAFGAGHSSTALSAGLGLAEADRIAGREDYTVVILGDGAYTGGMVHEALNNCRKDLHLILILNENEISISKNIGRFADYLTRLRTSRSYLKTKKATAKLLRHIPFVGKTLFALVRDMKKGMKNMLYDTNYFENMGLTYLGPADGNNLVAMERLLHEAKSMNESVLLHIRTKKGKGYLPAEEDPTRYHGISPAGSAKCEGRSFSQVMGETLCTMAQSDARIAAITAAMCDGTGLVPFRERYKERFFDVGIAEEHALTFAAGLAAGGMRPFVALYSSFLQRGYDNVIHDIALQNLPVTICIDRAGLNASDGATHHGIFDVAFLSGIPNMTIYTPLTAKTLAMAMKEALAGNSPAAIRYPKGGEDARVLAEFYREEKETLGAACNFEKDACLDVLIITGGTIVCEALTASDLLWERGVRAGILLLEKIKPFAECAKNIASLMPKRVSRILFLEEEIRAGGMGMLISDQMKRQGLLDAIPYEIMGTDDSFVPRHEGCTMYADAGIDAAHIVSAILKDHVRGEKSE